MNVVNNHTGIFNLGGEVTLMPGANPDVDEKAWDKVKDLPVVKNLVKLGVFKVTNKSFASLKDVSAVDSIALIKQTANKEVLERWLQDERAAKDTRVGVIAAINKQLDELKLPAAK